MEKIYLLDASGYLYRSYFAISRMTNSRGESTNALYGFIRSLQKIVKDFQPTHIAAIFDGPGGAEPRKEIYPQYKAHRLEMPEDLRPQMQWARNFCELCGIPYMNIAKAEADDVIGTIAHWVIEQTKASVYICTTDKDLAQLVDERTSLINTFKNNLFIGEREVEQMYGVSPNQIIDWLALTGDASDNVPGVSGFGPKTAVAMLQQFGSLENMLANSHLIKADKKRKTLIEQQESARLSKKLVTIDLHVALDMDENTFCMRDRNVDALRDFYQQMEFTTLIKELPSLRKNLESFQRHLVCDEKSFTTLTEELKGQKEICITLHSVGDRARSAQCRGIALCFQKHSYYIAIGEKLSLDRVFTSLRPLFADSSVAFFGHNFKRDLHLLYNLNAPIANISFDTILASYLLNSHLRQYSLENLAITYLNFRKKSFIEFIGKGKAARDPSLQELCSFFCEEVELIYRLQQLLQEQLKERSLLSIFHDVELPLLVTLAQMEQAGIFVDVSQLQTMAETFAKQIEVIEKQIYQLSGELFNINSPKQLSEILYKKMQISPPKKTATGFSTDAKTLEFLKEEHPICDKILEYRTLEKLRSTYLDALPKEVDPETKRVHCTFNQVTAATGRLACQDPNLQNIPVRTEIGRAIRGAFKPQQKNCSLLSADYSQIELRFLAHFSRDPQLIEAFTHNRDVHAHTASVVFEVALHQVTKEMRDQAKTVNFGVIYGQQAFGLSKQLGIDLREAADFIKTYFLRYSSVQKYLEDAKESARLTGRSTTIIGRERSIPDIHSKNGQIRAAAERLAINSPLQGSAADLIKMAMLRVEKELKRNRLQAQMILQVHDELIFEVVDSEIEQVASVVKESMENVMTLCIPLVADITIGKNWQEC